MVEHHVLSNVFTILQLVHLVVSVRVQHRPAQELGQSLRNRDQDQHNMDSILSGEDDSQTQLKTT